MLNAYPKSRIPGLHTTDKFHLLLTILVDGSSMGISAIAFPGFDDNRRTDTQGDGRRLLKLGMEGRRHQNECRWQVS